MVTATDIIRELGLRPHPEGGHFIETFRDQRTVNAAPSRRRFITCSRAVSARAGTASIPPRGGMSTAARR
jgi:hypothetical protein